MFASEKWTSSNFSKLEIGKNIESIVLDTSGFWASVSTCLLAAIPLIKVLRMVDSDSTPAMGFIYQAMKKAKKEIISNYKDVQSSLDLQVQEKNTSYHQVTKCYSLVRVVVT
ncbi:hypothetical protein Tco_0996773 [Tanacetum coccineum]